MMEVTNVHIFRWYTSNSLTINLHHDLSTVTMDDPELFTEFVRNTLKVTTQWTINVITNFVESFEDLLAVNDVDIDTFVKDTHSTINYRASGQIILISNNVTQGIKLLFFELKDR